MRSTLSGELIITVGTDRYHLRDCKVYTITQDNDIITESSYDYELQQHCYGKPSVSGTIEAVISDQLYLRLAKAVKSGDIVDMDVRLYAAAKMTGGMATEIQFLGVVFESLPLIGGQFSSGSAFQTVSLAFRANDYTIVTMEG